MDLISSDDSSKQAASLQVVFLVDITGSMGTQIEGVKEMVAEFCKNDRPFIDVHIWTFTENPGCHVSKSPQGLKAEQLVAYTKDIKLCRPPDMPSVNAGGGDGPENVTAGVASLLDTFESSQNLLVFIITDAPPHHKCFGDGTETQDERKWLREKKFEDTDVFVVLCEIIDSLNVTFVPVLYGSSLNDTWFHQAAVMTEGLVLCPKSPDSKILANGLSLLLDSFQKLSESRDLQLLNTLDIDQLSKAFGILDICEESFEITEEDPIESSKVTKEYPKLSTSQQVLEKILNLFKTTFDRFSGKKASKRCRAVNAEHMSKSIKVFLLSLLHTTGSNLSDDNLLDSSTNDLKLLLSKLKETDSKYDWELKLLNNYLESLPLLKRRLCEDLSNDEKADQIECMVSLAKLASSLKDLPSIPVSEQELSEWMDLILQLCLVKLINVKFPLDVNKNPDFADAWAASITNIEFSSSLSASAAILLRGEDNNYVAPVSLNKNSAALIIAHPNDRKLSDIYKSLSFFPTLQGLIQSHLISGSFKVFPSIVQGLQASVFWFLIRGKGKGKDLMDVEWEMIRCVAHSLRCSAYQVVPSVFSALKQGLQLNPVDHVSKLIAGYLSFFGHHEPQQISTSLRILFEELSADIVAWELKKVDNEKFVDYKSQLPSDRDVAEAFVCLKDIESFDPFSGIHDFETICKEKTGITADFLQKVAKKMQESGKMMNSSKKVFKLFCMILRADLLESNFNSACNKIPADKRLDQVLNDSILEEIFVESFLLRKRTKRYDLDENTKEWKRPSLERVNEKVLTEACIEIINKFLTPTFSDWNLRRKAEISRRMLDQVSKLQGETIEDFNRQLEKIDGKIAEVYLKFSRMDVIDALEGIRADDEGFLKRLETLGQALVIGNWTKAPPSQLKRFSGKILEKFSVIPELKEKIEAELRKEQVCSRPEGSPNRHGHTVCNPFPGIRGWTQEYHDKVLAVKKGIKKEQFLNKMKEFTLFYRKMYDDVFNQEGFSDFKREMIESCINFSSGINLCGKVYKLVDRVLCVRLEDVERENGWENKVDEVKKKFKTSKHALDYLEKLLTYVESKKS
jgi:hypothetical protein